MNRFLPSVSTSVRFSILLLVLSIGALGCSPVTSEQNPTGTTESRQRAQISSATDSRPRNIQPTRLRSIAPGSLLQLAEVNVTGTDRPSISPEPENSQSIQVIAQVIQETLLEQEFLYGADLQYSSRFNSNLDLYHQSMAMGHIPCHFRIEGDELQLVADNKILFPSDVNHPAKLLSRFKILSRSKQTNGTMQLTLSAAQSGITLADFFSNLTQDASKEPLQTLDSWIRSFEFIPDGNYILQQTSITLSDGTLAEFLESIFPSENLKPGKSFTRFDMDPTDMVGAKSGPVERFRFLAGGPIFENEEIISYAQHFDLSPNAAGQLPTIDFYVTPNIPDQYLEAVKNGIEGWNRYFLSFSGIERAVTQFKGKLPRGIHLGDPRYNVIAWDNRKVAGAAYETQASDPRTGKQSHAIIYMPAAWVNIGENYWRGGKYSDVSSTKILEGIESSSSPLPSSSMPGWIRSRTRRCDRNLDDIHQIIRSGRLSREEATLFGIQTLTSTLFHEVGHALGEGHNFKGSLNFDRSDPHSLFSTSIMDYNDFEMERQAFDSVHTWKGPLLEYDRQALSTLYNEGKDVTPSSPILPACADAEADQQIPGVDPLCNRYDIENDPTHSVITAYQRLSERSLPNDVTLSQAILRVGHDFVTAEAANPPVTADELIDYTKDLIDTLVASIRFYVFSGKASLTGTLLTNIKSLQQFRPDVFAKTPNRYNESKLRLQFLLGLNEFFKLEVLPPAVTEALSTISQLAVQSLGQSPALQAVDATTRSGVLGQTQLTLAQLGTHFVEDTHEGLPAARALILSALRKRVAPYFLGSLAGQHYDFEAMITNLLFNHLINPEASKRERTRAAASLTSFKNRSPMIDQLIKTANTSIEAERNTSQTNGDRENAIDLISILSQKTGNKK